MTDNFLGEIRLFACSYAPSGWALCNGAVLQIQSNVALYSLIGQNFAGGNGTTTFALPDLRGRVPVGMGQIAGSSNYYTIGNTGGTENVALSLTQTPAHKHLFQVYNGQGTANEPNDVLAVPHVAAVPDAKLNVYHPYDSTTTTLQLNPGSIVSAGTGAAHGNMQPFLSMNFCIALQGIYPQRP